MTKFLLRDGSLIDVETEAAPEDVFSYTNTDGTTIHAALSEKAEMEPAANPSQALDGSNGCS